jgi:hypothetical protein
MCVSAQCECAAALWSGVSPKWFVVRKSDSSLQNNGQTLL